MVLALVFIKNIAFFSIQKYHFNNRNKDKEREKCWMLHCVDFIPFQCSKLKFHFITVVNMLYCIYYTLDIILLFIEITRSRFLYDIQIWTNLSLKFDWTVSFSKLVPAHIANWIYCPFDFNVQYICVNKSTKIVDANEKIWRGMWCEI